MMNRGPSKFIALADNMKSAISMAWEHGGADFQSRFDKSTGQAQEMKEGRVEDSVMLAADDPLRIVTPWPSEASQALVFLPYSIDRLGRFTLSHQNQSGDTMTKTILLSVLAAVIFGTTAILFAQEQATKADYNWLNGKWEGTPPLGGNMQKELRVDKGNQFKGSGHIVHGGSRHQATRQIEGTVNGDKVELEFFGHYGTVKYVFDICRRRASGDRNCCNPKRTI